MKTQTLIATAERRDPAAGAADTYCASPAGKWVRVVRDYVRLVEFGEVHLTVHRGHVVEVRKMEKVRFDTP